MDKTLGIKIQLDTQGGEKLKGVLQVSSEQVKQLSDAVGKQAGIVKSAKTQVDSYMAALSKSPSFSNIKMSAAFDSAGKQAAAAAKAVQEANAKIEANNALKKISSDSNAALTGVDRLSERLANMGHIATTLFAGKKLFDIAAGAYKVEADIQSITSLLKTVTGTAAGADAQFTRLTDTSNKLGLNALESAKQFAFFAAAAKEAGFSQAETNQVFLNFQSALSGLQVSSEVAQRVFAALTQMASNPKVALEELKTQLGEALPGVISKAARAIGEDTQILLNKISKGELVSAEFIKAFSQVLAQDFPAITDGARQSINRLENSWVTAQHTFAKSGFIDGATAGVDTLTKAISDNKDILQQWGEKVGETIQYILTHGPQAGAVLGALTGARFGLPGAVVGGAMGYSAASAATKTLDDEIALRQKKIKVMEDEGFAWKLLDDATGQDIQLEKQRLDNLLKSKEAKKAPDKPVVEPPLTFTFNKTTGFSPNNTQDTADKKNRDALNNSYQATVTALTREIALRGDNSAAAAAEYDVQYGALVNLSEAQKLKLRQLSAEKDAIRINAEAYKEYDDIVAEGQKLADKQRADSAAENTRLNEKFNSQWLGLQRDIADARSAKNAGLINGDQMSREIDKATQAYEKLASDGTSAVSEMSEFSIQAARNMQSAFADFLFDPMQGGFNGMVDGFAKTMRRMLAEAASAKIFEALLGKGFGTDGAVGGILQGVGNYAASMFGGGFNGNGPLLSYGNAHTGGIIGQTMGRTLANPDVFSHASRYHSGGIAGLKPNEVPTVLLRGEEVLTTNDPRHRNNLTGGGGNVTVNVNNMADGTKASATSKSTDQGTQIDVLIEKIESAIGSSISRGTGIAPVLERQYGLNRAAGSY